MKMLVLDLIFKYGLNEQEAEDWMLHEPTFNRAIIVEGLVDRYHDSGVPT
jgi:hypothetical protein